MSLTQELNYSAQRANACQSRSYQTRVPSVKQTYNGSNTMQFWIPTQSNAYLNPAQSYLKFKVTNSSTKADATANDALLDGGAWCFFQSITIYHGSNLLEFIDNYAQLYSLMMDVNTQMNKTSFGSVVMGMDDVNNRMGCKIAGNASTFTTTNQTTAQDATFCIPIMSSIIGTLLDKHLPLCSMVAGGDIRVEFVLRSNPFVLSVAGTTNYTLSDCELMLDYIELNAQTQAQMDAQFGGNYQIHGTSFRNYVGSVFAQAGSQNIMIPAKFDSVKAIYCLPILNTVASSNLLNSSSSRTRSNLTNYIFHIGALNYPQRPVSSNSESFCELMKAFHNLVPGNTPNTISARNYYATSAQCTTAATSYYGAYAVGLELESFSHSSNTIMSGVNTKSINTYVELYSTANMDAMTLYSYVCFDQILTVSGGIASVTF